MDNNEKAKNAIQDFMRATGTDKDGKNSYIKNNKDTLPKCMTCSKDGSDECHPCLKQMRETGVNPNYEEDAKWRN